MTTEKRACPHCGWTTAEQDALSNDADRFIWWFSNEDKIGFMPDYLKGMAERWTLDQWRAAIDRYRADPTPWLEHAT